MSKPQKSSRAPPQPRKLPDRAPKASKWPQKQNIKNSEKQKILQKESYPSIRAKPQKLFRPHLNPKNNPIKHKKAENETKKNRTKKSKVEKKLETKVISYKHFIICNISSL